MRSAIVLVGGEGRRVNGMEKYFFTYLGKTFIERLIKSLQPAVDEIILVAKSEEHCERFSHLYGVRCVHDIRKGTGPMGGLHAGVRASRGNLLFVCACDMPCIDTRVVSALFDALGTYDAAIPSWDSDMLEPLHAVYRKEPLQRYLEDPPSLSLRNMVKSLNVVYVPVSQLRNIDPDLSTFTNINKLEDLEDLPKGDHS
ncbi:MAG: molybdenum cofactor guanylyltransferase [Methanoregulaceae archaeon]|nr:molybdenum cofactor guanylyltransferase [Methanoregulaceae archaeon]